MDGLKNMRLKQYWELLAKISLVQYFGFCNEDIYLADKPDIQSIDQKYGIEVVLDVFKEQMELEKFAISKWGLSIEQIPFDNLEKFKREGGKIRCDNSSIITSFSLGETNNTSEHLKETICKKIDLLNKEEYMKCKEYSLYVFTDIFSLEYYESLIVEIMEYVQNYQKKLNLKFKRIFLDQHYLLYEYDLIKGDFNKKIFLSKEMISDRRKTIDQILKKMNAHDNE